MGELELPERMPGFPGAAATITMRLDLIWKQTNIAPGDELDAALTVHAISLQLFARIGPLLRD